MEVILGGARSGKTHKIVQQMKAEKEKGSSVVMIVTTERERRRLITAYKLDPDDVVVFQPRHDFLRGMLYSTKLYFDNLDFMLRRIYPGYEISAVTLSDTVEWPEWKPDMVIDHEAHFRNRFNGVWPKEDEIQD